MTTGINVWKEERRINREMAFDETDILGGKAVILMNVHEMWQFRMWVASEKKYVRESLKTRDKALAIELAENKVYAIGYKLQQGEKIFGITVDEACNEFLKHKAKQVGLGEAGIVKGRFETIKTHLRHFIGYTGRKIKANEVTKLLLQKHVVDGIETDYVSYRKQADASDSTIRNELSSIGMCFTWLAENGHTNIHKLKLPYTAKNKYDIDNNLIRRQTFTADEYRAFTNAFKSFVAVKKNELSEDKLYDRLICRDYLLFQANSGMRSGELRQLTWENVEIKKYIEGNKQLLVADVTVEAHTSKVRKGRQFISLGAEYLMRIAKTTNRTEGLIFSRDGKTQLHNSFIWKGFEQVMRHANIDKKRKKQLVPYSLQHFFITKLIQDGGSFEQAAMHCGTSVKIVQNTYLHINEKMKVKTAISRHNITDKGYELVDVNI